MSVSRKRPTTEWPSPYEYHAHIYVAGLHRGTEVWHPNHDVQGLDHDHPHLLLGPRVRRVPTSAPPDGRHARFLEEEIK